MQKEHQFDFMTGVLVHGELWYAQTQLMFGLQEQMWYILLEKTWEDYIPTIPTQILFRADLAKGMSVFANEAAGRLFHAIPVIVKVITVQ